MSIFSLFLARPLTRLELIELLKTLLTAVEKPEQVLFNGQHLSDYGIGSHSPWSAEFEAQLPDPEAFWRRSESDPEQAGQLFAGGFDLRLYFPFAEFWYFSYPNQEHSWIEWDGVRPHVGLGLKPERLRPLGAMLRLLAPVYASFSDYPSDDEPGPDLLERTRQAGRLAPNFSYFGFYGRSLLSLLPTTELERLQQEPDWHCEWLGDAGLWFESRWPKRDADRMLITHL